MSPALPSTELPLMQCCRVFNVFHVTSHCLHCLYSCSYSGRQSTPDHNGSPRRQRSHRLIFASLSCWQFDQKVASTFYNKHSPFSIKMVRTEPFPPAIFGVLQLFPVRCRLAIRIYGHGAQQREALLLRLRPVQYNRRLYDIIVVCMIQHDATRRHIQKKRRGQANADAAYHLTLTLPQLFFFIWRRVISCHIIKTAPNTGHAGPRRAPPCW